MASIEVTGPGACEALGCFFRPVSGRALGTMPVSRIVYGRWGSQREEAGGEDVVLARLATEHFEVHCHGGSQAVARVVSDLRRGGAAMRDPQAPPGVTVAEEAQRALIRATTERSALLLLDQCHGALVEAMREIVHQLERNQGHRAAEQLKQLLATWRLGRRLIEPWRVVLTGRPNVGKSSLINALMGFDRSIVENQPGTTRDVVTARGAVDGWPVEFSDTAGVHEAADGLELAGIRAAEARLRSADAVLWVCDAADPQGPALPVRWPREAIVMEVWNKADRLPEGPLPVRPIWLTSATEGRGLAELLAALGQRLVPHPPAAGTALVFTRRQRDRLAEVAASLGRGDRVSALRDLQQLASA